MERGDEEDYDYYEEVRNIVEEVKSPNDKLKIYVPEPEKVYEQVKSLLS